MNKFQEKLASAIQLRGSKKHEEARQLLLELHSEYPEDPQVNYQCAWIHDLFSLEKEAVPFYEKAVQAGLRGDPLKSALPGMRSTYCCIGEYDKSIDTFQRALTLFPGSHEFKVFPGMAYYNVSEHAGAMEQLLNSLVDTSNDKGILRYQRAIRFYSDKLHQTW